MSIKNDEWIRHSNVIEPCAEFTKEQSVTLNSGRILKAPCISYGISSYGYDVRCSDKFKVFTNINTSTIDPKQFKEDNFVDFTGSVCIIPPNSFVLTTTVEYFRIPRDILALCVGKSTYARCGVVCNTTPLEPEFEGHITIELSNTTPLPVKIYANEGIAQVIFFSADEVCKVSYADRKGKYNNQVGITLPKV